VCRMCLERVFGVTQEEFVKWRKDENWACVHCQDLCPNPNTCVKNCPPGTELADPSHVRSVHFVWPHESQGFGSLNVAFAKRGMNGEFPPLESAERIPMSLDSSTSHWYLRLELEIGAYRCEILGGKTGIASSTVQVLPCGMLPLCSRQSEHKAGSRQFFGRQFIAEGQVCKPRSISWNVSGSCRSGNVHALPLDNGEAQVVRNCSRTEGYDWRRAKQHAVLQWLPEHKVSSPGMSYEEQHGELRLSASTQGFPRYFSRQKLPKLKIGMSHKEFCIASDTVKFSDMRESSVWAIVTGKSSIHGIGLFTLTGYQKGDFVIEYSGDLIRTPLSDLREARYEAAGLGTYLFKINEHHIVDATVNSNRARFTNHSCDPNMRAGIIHVCGRDLVVLQATREIYPYSELTFDYQLPIEDQKLQCLCNSWNCVGVMN